MADEHITENRCDTGLPGLDHILGGGYFKGRPILVVGSAGSGKTILTLQSLSSQITNKNHNCLFVTFEERPNDIVKNAENFSWNLDKAVLDKKLFFIDASPDLDEVHADENYDLSGLLAQIESSIKKNNIQFVVLDSIGSLFFQYKNTSIIRKEIFRILQVMRRNQVTALITAERLEEYGTTSRFGVEEFVTDGVIVLRHTLREEKVRRTIQVHKLRGGAHHQGEFPFTIADDGIYLSPLSMMDLSHSSSMRRISFGDPVFDEMTGGGLFNDSVLLISGPTGAGKTLLCSTFVAGGCLNKERVLFLGFEESKSQLARNAQSWGYDFDQWEANGLLRLECIYPEYQGLEEHLMRVRNLIQEFEPTRIVIDSVSALERISTVRVFREFVIGLTALVKQQKICSVFTSTSPKLSGGDSITDTHISTITDTIVMLRYMEQQGALSRGLVVIKMRGSAHDKSFREFSIDGTGIHIKEKLKTDGNERFILPTVTQ